MKANSKILGLLLLIAFGVIARGLAQQDPYDPGSADTLYFDACSPRSSDGDTLYFPSGGGDVIIYINIWNDEYLRGMTVPLTDLTYGPPSYAFLDSSKNNGLANPLCFQGSRVENFSATACNLDSNPPQVLYEAVSFADSMLPGDGLFATMVYTVSDTGRICLDTLLFFPDNILSFSRTDHVAFAPQFVSKCFHLMANNPPVLDSIGGKEVNEGQLLEFTIAATDPDGDSLIFLVDDVPEGAFFNYDSLVFSWMPDHLQSGVYDSVLFAAFDGKGGVDSEFISISVTDVNGPPELMEICPIVGYEGGPISFQVWADDPDTLDSLIYSTYNLPSGAEFDTVEGFFQWTPDYYQSGTYSPYFEVSDGIGGTDSQTVSIEVLGYRPPGDVTGDSIVGLSDIVFLVNYVLKSGEAPSPLKMGDANGSGAVDIVDIIYEINYLFKGGPELYSLKPVLSWHDYMCYQSGVAPVYAFESSGKNERIESVLFEYSTDLTNWTEIADETDDITQRLRLGIYRVFWNTDSLVNQDYYIRLTLTDSVGFYNQNVRRRKINRPPIAKASGSFNSTKRAMDFDGSDSRDNDLKPNGQVDPNRIVKWEWDFGDGRKGRRKRVSHRYADNTKTYFVHLKVTDDEGLFVHEFYKVKPNAATPVTLNRGFCSCTQMKIRKTGRSTIRLWWDPRRNKRRLGDHDNIPRGHIFYNFEVNATLALGSNPFECDWGQRWNNTMTVNAKTWHLKVGTNEYPYDNTKTWAQMASDNNRRADYPNLIFLITATNIIWVDGPGFAGAGPGDFYTGANRDAFKWDVFFRDKVKGKGEGATDCECKFEYHIDIALNGTVNRNELADINPQGCRE